MEKILETILEEIRGVKEVERRDNELKEAINEIKETNKEILKELKQNRIEHKEFDLRLSKVEFAQENLEERLLKSS